MTEKNEIQDTARMDALFERISDLIEQARRRVMTSVNIAEVYTKYSIGQYIVEEEQQGNTRAEYGKQVLKELSVRLTERFGDGWSVETLDKCRKFYRVYSSKQISSTMQTKLEFVNSVDEIENDKQCLSNQSEMANQCLANLNWVNGDYQILTPKFTLSWSHYLVLMRVDNPDARSFYEIECAQQQWSVRQLSRQVGSSLYERLALSRNKDEVMRIGQRAGKEAVQLYVAAPKAAFDRPVKELKAFCKSRLLQPNESQTVIVTVKREDLASWDETAHRWSVTPGTYTFLVGASATDMKLQTDCNIK